jgi:hypothetical protein
MPLTATVHDDRRRSERTAHAVAKRLQATSPHSAALKQRYQSKAEVTGSVRASSRRKMDPAASAFGFSGPIRRRFGMSFAVALRCRENYLITP